MRIDLFLAPGLADEQLLREKTVVVIDVLRASTTIVTALYNGAREIIPTTTIDSAARIASNLSSEVKLLGGERNGKVIDGFHLGNSPREYTPERVKGKTIVFTTTNGSQAVVKARYATATLICGLVNITAVQEQIQRVGGDLTILCAGREGGFSLEDTVCAGMLIQRVMEGRNEDAELSDGAVAARVIYRALGKVPLKLLRSTEHGKYLQEIGLGEDLPVCAAVDRTPVVPVLEENVLRLPREAAKAASVGG
jgi:2-phosphosulfolactate phosphatase